MKFFKSFLFASILSGCSGSEYQEGDAWSFDNSRIIAISKVPPHCGISYVLVEVQFRDENKKTSTIYLPCVEVIKKPLPLVGSWCSANGLIEAVNVPSEKLNLHSKTLERVARLLVCDGERYVFNL